jgi:hypothetical protein
MEADLDQFEELMNEIKVISETANTLSDAERRAQAERMIHKMMDQLGMDDEN